MLTRIKIVNYLFFFIYKTKTDLKNSLVFAKDGLMYGTPKSQKVEKLGFTVVN